MKIKTTGQLIGSILEKNNDDEIILGIDPGLQNLGIGAISINLKNKHEIQYIKKGKKIKHINPNSLTPLITNYSHAFLKIKANRETTEKLFFIFENICSIIEKAQPKLIIIEDAFVGINKNSALKLGLCRGSIMSAVGKYKIPIEVISPKQIKLEVTQKGNAEKTDIEDFFKNNLKNWKSLEKLDSSDALAAAFCGIKKLLPIQF